MKIFQGQSIPLQYGHELTLGRDAKSDVQFADDSVSRNHAVLGWNQDELWIKDLGSSNGTFLNQQQVQANVWRVVPEGSRIRLSDQVLQLSHGTLMSVAGNALGGPVGLTLAKLAQDAKQDHVDSKDELLGHMKRAEAAAGGTNGLVELPKDVPTLVLPDIHGRRDMLLGALQGKVDGSTVFDLLEHGKMNLVCMGDYMHGEARAAERWQTIQEDYQQGKPSAAMEQEMSEDLGTMKMVMELKEAFPRNFVALRGNHEEVKGNFAKYARQIGEPVLVRDWMNKRLGPDFVDDYEQFENQLPLLAHGQSFAASHSAPGRPLERAEVEGRTHDAFQALTWTENRTWSETDDSTRKMFDDNLQSLAPGASHWLVGHRNVDEGLYRHQMGDELIQMNDADKFVGALVPADGNFDPQRDVFKF